MSGGFVANNRLLIIEEREQIREAGINGSEDISIGRERTPYIVQSKVTVKILQATSQSNKSENGVL